MAQRQQKAVPRVSQTGDVARGNQVCGAWASPQVRYEVGRLLSCRAERLASALRTRNFCALLRSRSVVHFHCMEVLQRWHLSKVCSKFGGTRTRLVAHNAHLRGVFLVVVIERPGDRGAGAWVTAKKPAGAFNSGSLSQPPTQRQAWLRDCWAACLLPVQSVRAAGHGGMYCTVGSHRWFGHLHLHNGSVSAFGPTPCRTPSIKRLLSTFS